MRDERVNDSVSLHMTENRLRFRLIVIPEETHYHKNFRCRISPLQNRHDQKTQQVYWGFHLQVRETTKSDVLSGGAFPV